MSRVIACLLLGLASATVFFKEEFLDESWRDRWFVSNWNKDTQGEWKWTAGKWFGEATQDKGIQTSQDFRFYAISARFNEFSNEGKDLVVQFEQKFEQEIDCGGGYIKLLPPNFDQDNFGGDTPYHIMFGPDVCGSTRKTHLIFTYKDKNLQKKTNIRVETDQMPHVYTLVLRADNTFQVFIDGTEAAKGDLESEWDFLPAKSIKDPDAKKPEDWVDNAKIPDPTDVKPADWDDIPEFIPDPAATKPEDWDDENDGEWEAPLIENPEYKGEWQPRMIDNPDYKGPWVHPTIDNPEYVADDKLYQFNFGGVGIELWQVKSGTFFDNIVIADDRTDADELLNQWKTNVEAEKTMKKDLDAAKQAEEEDADADLEMPPDAPDDEPEPETPPEPAAEPPTPESATEEPAKTDL